MSISPELKKLVEDGDLVQVRCYLANYLVVDRSFALFDESLAYVVDKLPVLQDHDGSTFEKNQSLWDREYLNKQIVAAFSNFSKERISHIKEVVTFITSQSKPIATYEETSDDKKVAAQKTGRTVIEEEVIINGHGQNAGSYAQHHEETAGSETVRRTGRRILEETPEGKRIDHIKIPDSGVTGANDVSTSKRTGRHILSETETTKKDDGDHYFPERSGKIDMGTAMIVGGVAIAAVGVVVVKPVVIGAGVAVAGVAIATKVSNKNK